MDNLIGKRLGKVQIEALIGRGGVAEVYLGTHTTLGRKVAVKVLRNLNEENSDALERFEREARTIAKLRHPNIVQVHDFDTIENNPYLVMEFIEGPSLSKYLATLHQNKLRLPLAQVVRLVRAIASALQYAHSNAVIHRDVKPGNIMLTSPSARIEVGKPLPEDFEPVLTDFGLVRFTDQHRQTTTGHIAGTPAYMSPEQARGEAVDGRADIYSLGIVLYELLAGDVPFDGESTVSILLMQVTEPPAPIPGLPAGIQSVLNRVLAKNIKDRFQTATEFANALSAAVDLKYEAATVQFNELPTILPTEALPPIDVPPAEKEPPAKPQRSWLRIALPALVVVALVGILLFRNLPLAASKENTPTASAPASTDTLLPATPTGTQTPTPTAVIPTGPIGVLHFQNDSALADQATLITEAMPAAPPGNQYQIWLTGGDERLSLGFLIPDTSGKGKLIFSEPNGLNLISRYDMLEITIEPNPDEDPQPSGIIAYFFTLPEESLLHVRYLLASFPRTPEESSLVQGLHSTIKQINDLATEMQSAVESSDLALVKQKGETALNLLVGAKSPEFKDWNGDGKIEPRASYGLVLNGSEFGYIQATISETDVTLATTDATEPMLVNGKVVKTCAQNLNLWTPDLRALLLTILNTTEDGERSEAIRALVTLTNQMLNGVDVDKSGSVDPIAGECGAAALYEYAYRMADMPLLPASISYQLTSVANSTSIPLTLTSNPNAVIPTQAGPTPKPTNTPRVQPTQKPKPTPKPTNPNSGGNNGGGNNGGGGDKPPKATKEPKN